MIFPFWFVDKSALAYGSSSWTNPAISMQLYRYKFKLYRYNFTNVDFQASCTGTSLGCTGTICLLPLFQQVVPVQVWVVPVQYVHCHFFSKLYRYKFGLYRYNMSTGAFLALLEFPRLRQLFTHIHSASYWLPEHTSLCTYVLNLKDLHKSKNIEEIRSTYSYAKCW